jgi:catechol 2,3-dioxygenase-like lactoylglutathione lyase family enzyme
MTPTFDMIGIVVNDLAASLAFYRRLGLDIPEGSEKEPHVDYLLPSGIRIAWDPIETIHSFDPEWAPPIGAHRIALAFRCATPAEVDAKHAELVSAGYRSHKVPWDAFWGQRYATVMDPDGNGVDLFADLPRG